jgi:hypothetical protein
MKTLAASVLGLSLLFATNSAHADRVVIGRPGVVVRGGFCYVGPRVVVPGPYYGYGYGYGYAPYVAPAPVYVGPSVWGPHWWGPRFVGRAGFRGWRR